MSPFAAQCCIPSTLLLLVLSLALLLLTSGSLSLEAVSDFTIGGDEYDCSKNIICLGSAHVDDGNSSRNFWGRLSLAQIDENEINAGIAYFYRPIRVKDPGNQQSASFRTSFEFFEVPTVDEYGTPYPGDGIAFVLSSDNSTLGHDAGYLGFFDENGLTSFKSVVVEFDSFRNEDLRDINNNHVSIDIRNLSWVAARNASDVGIHFYNETPVYAWIEYTAETQTLEVRISSQNSRPVEHFLTYTFNLSQEVEEQMWTGFSGANGALHSSYYVGNWTFQAYGLSAEVHHKSRKWGRFAIILVTAAALVGALGVILVVWYIRRRLMRARGADGPGRYPFDIHGSYEDKLRVAQQGYQFNFEELRQATKNFADEAKIGEGGFGCVYRGQIPNTNIQIAVKRILRESQQGENEFKAEVSVISQLRHRNLIRLWGWCIDDGKHYIVYDLMPNGSLDRILTSDQERAGLLSWSQRYKIAQGIANAVEYLHHGWIQKVIHRDIKSSNIMLDDQFNASLGDFGLARLIDHRKTPNSTTTAGTPGYIAPEALSSRKFTEKTDVFAFGAVALEIACGRKALMIHAEPEEMELVEWVWGRMSEGSLLSVVDKRLGSEYDVDQMKTLLVLGLLCSHPDPSARPSMRVVVQVLYGEVPVPSVPTTRPFVEYS